MFHITTINLNQLEDTLEWRIPGLTRNTFSSSDMYNSIRDTRPLVRWHLIIWFKLGIPKHKSLFWMVLLNHCPRRDRLLSWSLHTGPLCLLSNHTAESRNHLYFDCPFSATILTHLASKLGLILHATSWETTMEAMISFSGSKDLKYLTLLAW